MESFLLIFLLLCDSDLLVFVSEKARPFQDTPGLGATRDDPVPPFTSASQGSRDGSGLRCSVGVGGAEAVLSLEAERLPTPPAGPRVSPDEGVQDAPAVDLGLRRRAERAGAGVARAPAVDGWAGVLWAGLFLDRRSFLVRVAAPSMPLRRRAPARGLAGVPKGFLGVWARRVATTA